MDKQTEFVLRTIEERDIRFVRLWFTDVLGTLKSVAVAPAELVGAFAEGLGFDGSAIEGCARVLLAGEIVSRMTVLEVVNMIASSGWRGEMHVYGASHHRVMAIDQGAVKYARSDDPDRRRWGAHVRRHTPWRRLLEEGRNVEVVVAARVERVLVGESVAHDRPRL